MRLSSLQSALLGLILVWIIPGCTVVTKKTVIPPSIRSLYEGEYEIGEYLENHQPGTVAILPFKNDTKKEEAFEIVRKTFYNHFSSLRYGDVELFKVDERLKKAGYTDPHEINELSAEKLGKLLGVDAVVYGTITHYDRVFAGLYSQVSVGAAAEMRDTKSGEFLWRGQHVERKHQGGVSATPVGLLLTVISTAVNVRQIELFRVSDDLFRGMIKTIPGPTVAEASKPPTIKMLVHDGVMSPKKAGDVLKVVLEGDPRLAAAFDIGDFKQGIEMAEVQTGFYEGTYQVKPGDNVREAIITGSLTDERGNTATWMDVLGTVVIDTTPPAAPIGLVYTGHDTEIALKWGANKEEDLGQYRLYRSQTPLTGYEMLLATEFNEATDRGTENYRPFYYKVSAVDKVGNESKLSGPIKGMAIPPGPTFVSGAIEKDTIWYAGASPYVINSDIYIRSGASLVIEPGTRINSKGSSLIIQGRLQAEGNREAMIIFDGFEGKIWGGITFDRVKDDKSTVSFCQVKNASAGLTLLSSSSFIAHNEFTGNGTGILVKESFSAPKLSENIIHGNTGTGIIVSEAASPKITGNIIKGNGEHGILCDNGTPLIQANDIIGNRRDGIHVVVGCPKVTQNNIHDNGVWALINSPKGESIEAPDNWWGTADGLKILSLAKGRVILDSALDGSAPEGKPFTLSVLKGPLSGTVKEDSHLIMAYSPYVVEKGLRIEGGTLYIQPGVTVGFNQGSSGIEVGKGGICAKGKRNNPISFVSNSPSPAPGDYLFSIKFTTETTFGSFFEYCRFKHGVNAVVIDHGRPDLTYSVIADNSQAGIICGNNASPKIEYNTLTGNKGTGAVFCKAMANPRMHYNNFLNNPFAIQSFSRIQIDARNNWWGNNPPDESLFIGNVTLKPWLDAPVAKAYDAR